MKTTVLSITLVIVSGLLFQAYAQEYLEGHVSKSRMTDAAVSRHLESQERMAVSYDVLSRTLDKIGQRKLQASQKDFDRFSKSHCAFETDYARNEPLEQLLVEDCLTSMNSDRTAYLDYQMQWNYTVDPGLAKASAHK